MKKKKPLTIELNGTSQFSTKKADYVTGWGEDGDSLEVTGEIREIIVSRDGEAQVGFRITDDGSVIITQYKVNLVQRVEQNVHLENQRPWK